MANPELGTKQICPTCSAKFYDLNKRPAHCPKCHAEFDPDEAVRNRRVRARAVVPDAEADEEREDQVAVAERDEDE
ncbi:MAG: TIGR02300 family protein, partial [Phenylobacterium sp.]